MDILRLTNDFIASDTVAANYSICSERVKHCKICFIYCTDITNYTVIIGK